MGLAVVLAAVYRWTRFGMLTRATAETETGAYLSGIAPSRIALFNWMISAVVAGIAGILIAPLSPLTPVTYTLFVVPALAAALVGGIQALIPTALAGLAIGMLQSESLSLAANHSWMPRSGAAELVPLILIVITLLVVKRPVAPRAGFLREPLGRASRPRSLVIPALFGAVVGLVLLAVTHGTWRAAVIASFLAAIIGLSQVVVTGFAGQVSLAQLTFAGCAAFTLSRLTEGAGVPFPIAPILAALVATAVGVVVALPALRLRGLMLGVVTLAFSAAVEAVWFRNSQFVPASGAPVKPPTLFGVNLGVGGGADFPRFQFGLLCLVTLVLVALVVAWVRRSALGSAMLAVRADERSAAGLGVNVVRVKVAAFAIGGFIAGLGGSLIGYRDGLVTFTSFTALGNLSVLATGYLAGITSVFGGVLAGLLSSSGLLFAALDRWVHLGDWFTVISGIGVIITLITHPEGLATIGHAVGAQIPIPRWPANPTSADLPEPTHVRVAPTDRARLLEVADLTIRYGEVMAVDEVSLRVDAGQVVGLIGPNGAGKTTVIDGIAGFAPTRGKVALSGDRIDGLVTHRRVRRGISRTFQSLGLYDDLTVEENLDVAVLADDSGNRKGAVDRALAVAGLTDLRGRPAGELSQGQRQLVSLARAYVAGPSVMLLDEPAAGLDTNESAQLGERIREIGSEGIGVLLVDHDVALVLSVCDYVYVLDVGRVIAQGSPDEIRVNREVMRAYLGGLDSDTEAAPVRAAEQAAGTVS